MVAWSEVGAGWAVVGVLVAALALFAPEPIPDLSPAAGPAGVPTLPRLYQGNPRLSGVVPPGLGVGRLKDEELPHLPLIPAHDPVPTEDAGLVPAGRAARHSA
jgi:hypothetical protein